LHYQREEQNGRGRQENLSLWPSGKISLGSQQKESPNGNENESQNENKKV